jgi:FAD synthase
LGQWSVGQRRQILSTSIYIFTNLKKVLFSSRSNQVMNLSLTLKKILKCVVLCVVSSVLNELAASSPREFLETLQLNHVSKALDFNS